MLRNKPSRQFVKVNCLGRYSYNSEHGNWFENFGDDKENKVDARELDVPQSDILQHPVQVIDLDTMISNVWELELFF